MRVVVAGGVAAALAIVALGCSRSEGDGGRVGQLDDEDRSQIIVRGGSAIFDDGTGTKAKPWKSGNPTNPNDKKKWQPDQDKGAPVSAYAVTVQQPAGAPGTPSTPCPTLALLGQTVILEYTTDKSTNPPTVEQFTFSIVVSPKGKAEPMLSSTVGLDQSPTIPSQLTYMPQTGWLSKVTIGGTDPAAPSESCSFDDPSTSSTAKAIVAIKPLK